MPNGFLRALALAAVLSLALPLAAAPPSTLTYQGTLGTAAGAPVSATLSIKFSLYDVEAGSAPLWDETQLVVVEAGKFAIELGASTPLPATLFANPLFLALTVQGDVEMTPRLALSSTPSAIRAIALLRNTTHVAADGAPQANAAALRQALVDIIDAADDNRYVIQLDAGSFDLGASGLVLPSFIELQGASPTATVLSSTALGNTLTLSSDSSIAQLGVLNSGSGGDFTIPNVALAVASAAQRVSIRSVAASSMPAPGVQGTDVRVALQLSRVSALLVSDVDLIAERSATLYGVRSTFPTLADPVEKDILLRDVRISLSAASNFARGFDAFGRQDVSIEGMRVSVKDGGLSSTNAIGIRTQGEVGLVARGLDVQLDFAAAAPAEMIGVIFATSAFSDVAGFSILMDSGTCPPTGYRNGIVFRNNAGSPTGRLQEQANLRDGKIVLNSAGCFAGGIYAPGAMPLIDNVIVEANQSEAGNAFAIGYVQRATSDVCNTVPGQAGRARISNSTITASAPLSTSLGLTVCVDGLSIEGSTIVGEQSAVTIPDNSGGAFGFSISHSRLRSINAPALDMYADGNGRISHSVLDSQTGSPIRALVSPDTFVRGTVTCLATSTAAAFTAGPLCPCTAGVDCPATP